MREKTFFLLYGGVHYDIFRHSFKNVWVSYKYLLLNDVKKLAC